MKEKLDEIVFIAAFAPAWAINRTVDTALDIKDAVNRKIVNHKIDRKNKEYFKPGGRYDQTMEYMKNRNTKRGPLVDLGEKKF